MSKKNKKILEHITHASELKKGDILKCVHLGKFGKHTCSFEVKKK